MHFSPETDIFFLFCAVRLLTLSHPVCLSVGCIHFILLFFSSSHSVPMLRLWFLLSVRRFNLVINIRRLTCFTPPIPLQPASACVSSGVCLGTHLSLNAALFRDGVEKQKERSSWRLQKTCGCDSTLFLDYKIIPAFLQIRKYK